MIHVNFIGVLSWCLAKIGTGLRVLALVSFPRYIACVYFTIAVPLPLRRQGLEKAGAGVWGTR